MMKIPKREYMTEFKELAVKQAQAGQTIGAVAKDLGLIVDAAGVAVLPTQDAVVGIFGPT
jgi:hypothetical protein